MKRAILVLLSLAFTIASCGGPTPAPESPRPHEEAATSLTFELVGATWTLDLPGASVRQRHGSAAELTVAGGPTFWVSHYPDGAGPIDLYSAKSIILDEPDPPVLFEQDREGTVSYELVVAGPTGPQGERLIDAPGDDRATILCSFRFSTPVDEPSWQRALAACRSLRPQPK